MQFAALSEAYSGIITDAAIELRYGTTDKADVAQKMEARQKEARERLQKAGK